ncbi:hypothetical protein [uncultured phage_MedDCM-OCT-S28-C10]|uniref:Uncharacterized protein n=1 Tax=uncultured phage_MedDCM-OCT-S28-C10 TaxID=2741077 RepID=A0A6S4PAD7_9CAUD|nr:hypothetical protein HOQ60_gp27 [uncultured phage_MedDCM-OCT-S28-C10]BAQ94070.1 hypothetical protein [uncultured phage_MedDCM-OCT-S28-C10]BAR25272.1 hypothetical protein [uncultured Mediterranean phage uvMED]BAR25317.1 hypothetical protein [uncultured Mediterranean phage uvMED]
MDKEILKLIKKHKLYNYYKDQTPIVVNSPEWNQIIEIACEIEKSEVEKNNLQKTNWIQTKEGITNTQEGSDFYYLIEDRIVSYFNIIGG